MRKTPCAYVKSVPRNSPGTLWVHCNCCGEWDIVNEKPTRPKE